MKLFTVPKVPCCCDAVTHRLERRKDHEVKVVDLTLRVQPFTAQLAAALDPKEYAFVKRYLFKQSDGSAIVDLKAAEFRLPNGRQKLSVFPASDIATPSIVFDQVKVMKLRVRTQKNVDGWALVVKVSFGPASKQELEAVSGWYTEQRAVTFDEAEPSLEFDADEEEAEETPRRRPRAEPMFDTDADGRPVN
jgi:hypothetical protein